MAKKRKHKETSHEKLLQEASPLALLLLQNFATGKLSATEVQQYAMAAQASGATGWDVNKLASLGCDSLEEQLKKFWKKQDFRKNPQFLARKDFWKNFDVAELPIPWLLHGDSAPFTEVDSLEVLSLRCAIGEQSVKVSELLLGCVPKSCKTKDTTKPWWDMLRDSFHCLAKGKMPDGRKVRKGVLMVIAGDLEWYNMEFSWPTASSNYCCVYCDADNKEIDSTLPFTDFRKDAGWKATVKKPDAEPPKHHPIYDAPGVSWLTLKLDMLHMIDLGVACHVYGNLLWSVMEDSIPGRSRASRMASLNNQISALYDELEIEAQKRMKTLHVSDLASGENDYPVLKHQKGARVRDFSKVAVQLAENYCETLEQKHRLEACKKLDEMYEMSQLKDYKWTENNSVKFEKAVEALLSHYSWLAKEAMKKDKFRYSVVLKHHLCAHYPKQCTEMPPRWCWCYGPESFMGYLVKIAAASVHGTKGWQLPDKVLKRFAFAWHLLQLGLLTDDSLHSS
eukprot:s1056_g15.t1